MSSEYEKFRQEQERLRREAEAQARERERQRLLDEQQRIRDEDKKQERREELQRLKIEKEQATIRELEQEARTVYPIYDTAESIRSRWTQQGANVQVEQIQRAYVELNDDGTVKRNLSFVGVRLSYSYRDVKTETVKNFVGDDEHEDFYTTTAYYPGTGTLKLSFGIGYFAVEGNGLYGGDTHDTYYQAEGMMSFSNEEKQKGVKSYYVDPILVVPVAYAESKNMFFGRIDYHESYINPASVLPAAARRLREHGFSERPTQPQIPPTPQKQGFFRRLFRRG